MGVEPPFLYDPPSRYSNPYSFNPKAVSQASLKPVTPKPKQEGPLVNFNRHPDSYLILPYGNTNAKPMSPRTKNKVRYSRFVLLFLRCCGLLGATGLFICSICIRGLENTTGWILRVPPAIAIFHSIYAVYHLGRKASGRTPGSSASYMLFAAAADVFLVPFFVFAALISNTEYQARMIQSEDLHWRTVFNNDIDANDVPTTKIVRSVFLFGVVNAGLYLVTLLVSLYLAIMFRRITKLPPDMNPLESNLTSRHKKKNSSITAKHNSTDSMATISTEADDEKRTVPFMHTRLNSASGPRASRADLPSLTASARSSKTDLTRSIHGKKSPGKRASQFIESRSIHDIDSPLQAASTREPKSSLQQDNWYVHVPLHDESEDIAMQGRHRDASTVSSLNATDHLYNGYEPLQQPYVDENEIDLSLVPHPLGMNPPTPQPGQQLQGEKSLTPKKTAAMKTRYYGDLKSATPPIMFGTCVDLPRETENRVVSTGNDLGVTGMGNKRRDVSGKIAEEGRSFGWGRRNV